MWALDDAIEQLAPALRVDGFDLLNGGPTNDGRVKVVFVAGAQACADCVVPDSILVDIIEAAIRERGADVQVVLEKRGFDG
jgi:hypothetical protein